MHKADKYFCDLALKDLCSAVLVKDLEPSYFRDVFNVMFVQRVLSVIETLYPVPVLIWTDCLLTEQVSLKVNNTAE